MQQELKMKSLTASVFSIWLVLFACFSSRSLVSAWFGPAEVSAADSNMESPLGVDQFMRGVDRYRGVVRVKGIVSAITPSKQMFSLIDLEEFKKCGVITCATLTLPVYWTKAMPGVRDTLIVEGEVRNLDGKMIFDAKNFEKVTSN